MSSPDASKTSFIVRRATEADHDEVLVTLSDGYGRTFSPEWFRWKHLSSPWGSSECFVAEDDEGVLGLGFKMPWRFVDDGTPTIGWRLVDGASTIRSQRRGVFRAVVAEILVSCATSEVKGVALATATPEARQAHIKNGALALDPISSFYRPAMWQPSRVVTGLDILDCWQPAQERGIASIWDRPALEWRLDPRSGIEYHVSQLASSASPNGAIHHTVGGAIRTLVVSAVWGAPREVNALLRALAWQSKAVAVLAPGGPGTRLPKPRLGVARGRSLMCVWDQREGIVSTDGKDARNGWALDGLDLEGVI